MCVCVCVRILHTYTHTQKKGRTPAYVRVELINTFISIKEKRAEDTYLQRTCMHSLGISLNIYGEGMCMHSLRISLNTFE